MSTPHKTADSRFARGASSDSELEYLTLMHAEEPTRQRRRPSAGPRGGRATLVAGTLIVAVLCVMGLGMWFASGVHLPADQSQQGARASAPQPG